MHAALWSLYEYQQTDVGVQFHPYAQLAEDSDFDERVRARPRRRTPR